MNAGTAAHSVVFRNWDLSCRPLVTAGATAKFPLSAHRCQSWAQVPEHTWGVDVKKGMPDYCNWSNADFRTAAAAGGYDAALHTWRRQRRYLDWAIEALGERCIAK